LVVLLPAILTVFVFVSVLHFVHTYVTSPINGAIYGLLEGNALGWRVLETMEVDPYDREYLDEDRLPPELADELVELGGASPAFQAAVSTWRAGREVFFRDFDRLAIDGARLRKATSARVSPLIGIVLSAALVLILGYFTSGFLGRQAISAFDRALHRLPVVRSVYPYTKQLVDFFLSDNELDFDTVVAAPYPSEGVWSIGFVTGEGLRTLHRELGGRYLSVFIPTSPMPMTGFTVFLEAEKLIPLDISVDEALRVTVSAGVLVPESEQPDELGQRLRALGSQDPDNPGEPDERAEATA
jgi:uncharacterized membrane protein